MINKRLLSVGADSNKHILYAVLIKTVSLFFSIGIAFLMASSLDILISPEHMEYSMDGKTRLLIHAGMILALIVGKYGLTRAFGKQSYLASVGIKKTLRGLIFDKVLELGNGYTSHITTAELVQAFVEAVNQLEIYFGAYLPQFFYSMISAVVLFVFLSFYSLKTALILLAAVPLIPISIMLIQKIAKRILGKYWGRYTKLGSGFLENIEGLTTLKIYQADQHKHMEMNDSAEKFRKMTMRLLLMQLNSIIMMDIFAYGGAALGMVVAVLEFLDGNISQVGVLLFIFLSAEFFLPMRSLGSLFHVAMNGVSASKSIFKLLDLESSPQGSIHELKQGFGALSFRHVNFGYDDKAPILENIDMIFQANSFTSVVGESGSGKSTIAKLMRRSLMLHQDGVFVGDHSINTLDEKIINKEIVLVSMNAHIFKGTVRENLSMGRPDADKQAMLEALSKVSLKEFILESGGLDFELKEGGSNLSGGQRQRLALARALLTDASVYIFDEATSNIDVESENKILNVLHELKNKTVIMISHRLANVVDSDAIYVLEKGNVVGAGTHESLLENSPVYQQLWNKQKELESYSNLEPQSMQGGAYAN